MTLSFDCEEDLEYHHFDDGWWCEMKRGSFKYVPRMIKLASGLLARGQEAMFFVTPHFAVENETALRSLSSMGHRIGVHLHMRDFFPHVKMWLSESARTDSWDSPIHYAPLPLLLKAHQAKLIIEAVIGKKVDAIRTGFLVDKPVLGLIFDVQNTATFDICLSEHGAKGRPGWFTQARIREELQKGTSLGGHPMVLDHDSSRNILEAVKA